MSSVFISYRHENEDHCKRVRDLALRLEKSGLEVVLDAFAEEREFGIVGPDIGWPAWSRKQAASRDHKILVIASPGWFKGWTHEPLPKNDEGEEVGLGSAVEAFIIFNRFFEARSAATFFRVVHMSDFQEMDIPVDVRPFLLRLIMPSGVAKDTASRDKWEKKIERTLNGIVDWLKTGPKEAYRPSHAILDQKQTLPLTFRCPRCGFPEQIEKVVERAVSTEQTEAIIPPEAPSTLSKSAPVQIIGISWCPVKAGSFKRGFNESMKHKIIGQIKNPSFDLDSVRAVLEAEGPLRDLPPLPEYKISRQLVTNKLFRQFVDSTSYLTTAERRGDPETWRDYASSDKANHPVVQVSFEDAQAFCRWAGVRLPTLNEWIKAYRGPHGNVYPWGDQFDPSKCNTAENKTIRNTSFVDMFAAHASYYGCYDMIGNVNEWIDASGDAGQHDANPAAIEYLKRTRVVMGGAWSVPCQAFGLPVVNMLAPIEKFDNDLGFRVAR